MKTIHRYYLAAALSLMCCAACTDAADDIAPDAPPTAQAIRLTAVRPAPLATRAVPGNDLWKGDGTEKIDVWHKYKYSYPDGRHMESVLSGTYTITSPDGTATALPGDKPVFWPEKGGSSQLSACYPQEGRYDISDQSTPEKLRQADLLITDEISFGYPGSTPVGLPFRHALAKVRVELTGVSAGSGEIKVEIQSRTDIELAPGEVSGRVAEAYITACPDNGNPAIVAFEAMVASTGAAKQNFLRITVGGKVYRFTPDAGTPDIFRAGRVYTYRVAIPSTVTP